MKIKRIIKITISIILLIIMMLNIKINAADYYSTSTDQANHDCIYINDYHYYCMYHDGDGDTKYKKTDKTAKIEPSTGYAIYYINKTWPRKKLEENNRSIKFIL